MLRGAFENVRRWWGAAFAGAMLVAATLALTPAAAAAAGAESPPRWALTAVPSPTNLVPESPRSEVDRLTVNATGGTYRLVITITDAPHYTTWLPYDASSAEVETAINGVTGGGNVLVTEASASASAHVYTVEWTGETADKSLEAREIESIAGEAPRLSGAEASVSYTPIVKGVSEGEITVTATNVGGSATSGTIELGDVLPAGLTATAIHGFVLYEGDAGYVEMQCESVTSPVCTWEAPVGPGGMLVVSIAVDVAGGLPANVTDEASVSGGGAATVQRAASIPVNEEAPAFGIAPGSLVAALSSKQAGAHANVTTAFQFASSEPDTVTATPKDVRFELPQGVVGNTVGVPRCSMQKVNEILEHPEYCPRDALVGMAEVTILFFKSPLRVVTPIYNIAPAPGEPAAFGFNAIAAPVRLDTSVLSNGNDAVRVTSGDLSEDESFLSTSITIWGVPSELDGPGASKDFIGTEFGGVNSSSQPVPLLSNPQQCTEPLSASLTTDPWVEPGHFYASEVVSLGTLGGCDQLRFSSSFSMVPDTLEAGAPAGYHFDLQAPQSTAPEGLATPNVKNVKLTLPAGTVVNPSAAVGLKACSNEQFFGSSHPSQEAAPLAACPRESQVGTVQVKTPALEEALEGEVYLAEPECHPCTPADAESGKMVRLFVQAVSEGEGGIVIKLEGKGSINQQTGQITTVFDDNPQLPFNEFKLVLAGGPRAVLANPRTCGPATSNIDLTPWSTPTTLDSLSEYTFDVNENCFGPKFAPSFKAGMPNVEAGGHGEFTLAFGRGDDEQFLKQITLHMPPGLLGTLTGVELCKEAQAIAGTCGANSEIGTTEVLTGPGADPFLVEGGKVFLTEGYGGSQFGLSIVVPAVAGPYTLGGVNGLGEAADSGTVVVRSKLYVDPVTTALTAVSEALPSMLDGIPLQLRAVNVRLNRPGFMFNPTSCEKTAITGTIASQEGMSANVTAPFQVTNCARLGFAPKLTASTSAKTSRKAGASLHVAIQYPQGAQGSEADIREVKVELPKPLPSELKTLQHACLASQFEANPAGCPKESIVGQAKAVTQILPVPLEGPAYFVSYGGAKFPELVIVLQGYGITVDLHGETFINEKTGVTASTFKTVPDDPVESFEITLPEQEYSALGAPGGKLCAKQLTMPTTMIGQNGAELTQSTKVEVQGCADKLTIESRKQAKGTLTLKVSVPSAGKLTARAKGVKAKSMKASARETVTLKLKLPVARHGGKKLKVKLAFKPMAKGKKLTKAVSVRPR